MRRRAGIVIALLVSLSLGAPSLQASVSSKPAQLARVRYIHRGLSVRPPHQGSRRGKVGAALYDRYLLQTKVQERASVAFRDGTILYLNQRTNAVLQDRRVTVVKAGEIDEVHPPGTNHTIRTASAVASAIGTNFDVRVRGTMSTFIVLQGSLLVKNPKGQVTVTKDQETVVAPNQAPGQPTPVDAQGVTGWTVPLSSGGWQVLKTPADFAPKGLAIDPQGTIDATDYVHDQVVRFSAAGKQLAAWGSKGTGPGQFQTVWGIALDSKGNFYVSDPLCGCVDTFDAGGHYLSRIGNPGVQGSNPGEFFNPDGLAVDAHDNLYVADQGNSRIQTFTPSGQPLAQLGSSPGTPAFSEPYDVAVDGSGNIYVADTGNDRIVRLSPAGDQLAAWGSRGKLLGQFDQPVGVTVDAAGNIFVADQLNGRIQELSTTGEPLTAWGTQGEGPGQFLTPGAVAVDGKGNLYVADSHRIQKLAGAAAASR